MMKSQRFSFLVALGFLVATSAANAQLLYDFETDIADVSNGANGGFPNTTVAHSIGVGNTSGNGALQATKDDGGGFAWVAIIQTINNDPVRDAIQAAYANPALWQFEFDVSVDPSTMPQWNSFVNGVVTVNSETDGFNQTPTEPWLFDGSQSPPATTTAVVPLTDVHGGNVPGGGWLELWFSANGDWGTDPGSIYIDNIRLTAIPEPASASLLALAIVPLIGWRRRR